MGVRFAAARADEEGTTRDRTPARPSRRSPGGRRRDGRARRAARPAVAAGRLSADPLRHARRALAGPRHGLLPDAVARRQLECLAGRRRRHRPGSVVGRVASRLARRQPRLDGAGERRPVPNRGPCHPAAGLLPLVARLPGGRAAAPHALGRRLALDRAAELMGGRREDRQSAAAHRPVPAARGRAPHGRDEPLHARPVGGDRARHRGLPRPRERLERHRLQLPRRSLRHRLRGPRRRGDERRDRRARARVQHGHRRCGPDRQLHRGLAAARDGGGARQAARLAP